MHRQAYLLLVLTTLFWGGNPIAGKLALGHISPMLLTAARWGIAAAILAYLGRQRFAADWPAIRARLPLLACLGFFGFTVFNVALYSALKYTSAINVSIEQAGIPMLIFIINFLLFGLRATPGQIVGFVLSIAGVALTASHGEPLRLLELEVNFGDALMLLSVIVYSGYTVALRDKPDVHWQSLMIVLYRNGVRSRRCRSSLPNSPMAQASCPMPPAGRSSPTRRSSRRSFHRSSTSAASS